MTNIKLPYEIKNNIGNHALREYPKECCGFLIGYIKDNLMICVTIKKVNNIASNPYNFFEIDPQEIINTQKQYRNNELSILGHYHSHPNSLLNSRPSKKDMDSIYDFNLCWVIVGINDNEVNYSAYIPKFTIRNTYNFKKINII